jgi:hypothetical protein
MLAGLTIAVMLLVGLFYFHEGIFTALTMCVNVFLAGLVAFNFWEPLANRLEPSLAGTFLESYEDAICLVVLFCVALGILRMVTNNLANRVVEYPGLVQQIGGVVFGLVTGYLVAGFMVCVLQTLPLHEKFLDFDGRVSPADSTVRQLLLPDRVWLALMRRAGAYPLANQEDPDRPSDADPEDAFITFDKYGTFEIRYERYRRYGDRRDKLPYLGECDREIHRK